MDVEAEGRARFHGRRLLEILGRGDLAVIVVARDHDNPQSRALGDGGIVGERRGVIGAERGRGAVGREQGRKPEDLGRLGAPQAGARHRFGNGAAAVDAFQGVGERHAQDGAVDARHRQDLQAGADIRRPNERAGGIVDGNEVRRLGSQRFQAIEHRLLTARPAHDRRRQVEAGNGCVVVASSPGPITTWIR